MKPRVLITSVSHKVWLIQAFREAGWHVIAQDADPDAVALRFADDSIPHQLDGLVLDSYQLIVPTRDAELADIAMFPNGLGPKQKTIKTCTDKLAFHNFCKQHNFKSPEVYFVKPRVSSSGKETECVWQEVIEGEEYSIDLFADFSGTVISIVPRKRLKVLSGESWVTETVPLEPFIHEVMRLSTTLNLIGHNVLQCFLTPSGLVWTDINLRFGGGSLCGIKAGCKSPEWLRELILGNKVTPQVGNYTVGLRMLNYKEAYFENTSDR